eukprot:TRINITY_DN10360_c0_g1_i3.p1 TRINITY_DN10360_c0_g1~~TRINITY_DN10360_c0_g1_i3.p1  ORF type:complete len:388 (-),score=94.16 TRINITY_DN10360_c0_g1_i3:774-1937(-)
MNAVSKSPYGLVIKLPKPESPRRRETIHIGVTKKPQPFRFGRVGNKPIPFLATRQSELAVYGQTASRSPPRSPLRRRDSPPKSRNEDKSPDEEKEEEKIPMTERPEITPEVQFDMRNSIPIALLNLREITEERERRDSDASEKFPALKRFKSNQVIRLGKTNSPLMSPRQSNFGYFDATPRQMTSRFAPPKPTEQSVPKATEEPKPPQIDLRKGMKGKRWFETEMATFSSEESPLADYLHTSEAMAKRTAAVIAKQKSLQVTQLGKVNKNALMARKGPGEYIIQPEFMVDMGSMCVTELWTDRQRREFKAGMRKEGGALSFDAETRDMLKFDGLYKRGKIEEQRTLRRTQARSKPLSEKVIIPPENRFNPENLVKPFEVQAQQSRRR